ncbi:uncharacterized protein LOC119157766 [Falco rusticolus]|uniref:uncharacterized protein LOC119157766 n=1 Tax=Falco rusticolus TaxID=120794 RepID=UPI000FFB9106|nr:uncharacterized protein LOC119157766 [Falco rusticolus]
MACCMPLKDKKVDVLDGFGMPPFLLWDCQQLSGLQECLLSGFCNSALPWLGAWCQQNTLQDPQQRRQLSSCAWPLWFLTCGTGRIPCSSILETSWGLCLQFLFSVPRWSWMLKSRGSINCRPSRGRGRQNWSRNAAESSSSAKTRRPATSCRRKLRSSCLAGTAVKTRKGTEPSTVCGRTTVQFGTHQGATVTHLALCNLLQALIPAPDRHQLLWPKPALQLTKGGAACLHKSGKPTAC